MKKSIKNQEKPGIVLEAVCFSGIVITAMFTLLLPVLKQANGTIQISL